MIWKVIIRHAYLRAALSRFCPILFRLQVSAAQVACTATWLLLSATLSASLAAISAALLRAAANNWTTVLEGGNYNAGGTVLLVDESRLNLALDMLKDQADFARGVIILLNDSTTASQASGSWSPSGSGLIWSAIGIPIQVAGRNDRLRLMAKAQQNVQKVCTL